MVVVPLEARGQRLDAYLANAGLGLTRSRIQGLIDEGQITCAGAPCRAAQRLKGGESLSVDVPAPVAPKPKAEALPLEILFEDKDVVVINKAAGVVVHPGAGHATGTLVNALLHHVVDLSGVGGEARPGIVHRLDKDTSGVMVVAKHDQALTRLQEAFKAREVEKRYLALVNGTPPEALTLRTAFGRHPKHRLKFTGRLTEGKPAVTHFKVKRHYAHAALVEVVLETGRTHQIRVHLSESGHALLGDALYGNKRTLRLDIIARQALHSERLAFAHPRTGKKLRFTAQAPADFMLAIERLKAER